MSHTYLLGVLHRVAHIYVVCCTVSHTTVVCCTVSRTYLLCVLHCVAHKSVCIIAGSLQLQWTAHKMSLCWYKKKGKVYSLF